MVLISAQIEKNNIEIFNHTNPFILLLTTESYIEGLALFETLQQLRPNERISKNCDLILSGNLDVGLHSLIYFNKLISVFYCACSFVLFRPFLSI